VEGGSTNSRVGPLDRCIKEAPIPNGEEMEKGSIFLQLLLPRGGGNSIPFMYIVNMLDQSISSPSFHLITTSSEAGGCDRVSGPRGSPPAPLLLRRDSRIIQLTHDSPPPQLGRISSIEELGTMHVYSQYTTGCLLLCICWSNDFVALALS